MSKRNKRITAEELMAQLNADPEFVAAREEREARRRQQEIELQRAERPLVDDLRAAGYAIESVWDLVNTPGSYPRAVPILFAHLPKPYPPAIREGIARALGVPEAKVGWKLLTRLYREEEEERVKDGLAVAVAGACDETVLSELIDLVRDTRNGPSRLLLLGALARSRDRRARATLMSLGTDPDLRKEIPVILRRLGRREH
jgi:hypothetical protein